MNKIGVTMATIICVNAMIGASMFTAPAALQTTVGPAGLLTYALVICAVWFMARSFAFLARRYPESGAYYIYASAWGGHVVGVIALGLYCLGLMVALGLLARITGMYLHMYLPTVSATTLSLSALWLMVGTNLLGVVISSIGQIILLTLTIIPLLLIIILCLGSASLSNMTPFAPFGLKPIVSAMKIVVFGFFGFECAPSLYPIVENPEKNVPRALNYSVLLVGFVYVLFVGSIMLALPSSLFTSAAMPISAALLQVVNYPLLATIIDLSIIVIIMGTIHSMIWAVSTLLHATVSKIQSTYTLSLRLGACLSGIFISLCCVAVSSINLFFALTAIGIVSATVLSIIALFKQWRRYPIYETVTALCGLITAMLIIVFALQDVLKELGW